MLRSLLTKEEILETESITVTGYIGRDDFGTLGLMSQDYALVEIDLSQANLVYPNSIYMQFERSKLKKIILPNLLTSINLYAFRHSELSQIVIPRTVREICAESFNDTKIEELTIPGTIRTIKRNTFNNTPLRKITIGGAREIDNEAFKGCDQLQSFRIQSRTPPCLHYDSFDNSHYENCTVFVPIGCKEIFEKSDYWIKFKNIVEETYEQSFSVEAEYSGEAPPPTIETVYYKRNQNLAKLITYLVMWIGATIWILKSDLMTITLLKLFLLLFFVGFIVYIPYKLVYDIFIAPIYSFIDKNIPTHVDRSAESRKLYEFARDGVEKRKITLSGCLGVIILVAIISLLITLISKI